MLSIPPLPLAIALVIGLLVLLPARRLQVAGIAGRWIGLYALSLWLLAFVLAVRPVAARFLVPMVVLLYLAPFVAASGPVTRAIERSRRGRADPPAPPMKNVTPPDPPGEPR